MLRVLHVLGSLQRGGAETFVMNVYRRIDRSKIQFDFLVKERVDDGYEKEAVALGARIFVVPSAKKIGFAKYIIEQKKVMQEGGPYLAVHSHVNYLSGVTLLAAKLAGIDNRIAHSHSTRFPQGFGEKISRYAIKPFSTKLFACSKEAGKALFDSAEFEVVGNGIDWKRFAADSTRERGQTPFTLVQLGRFVEVKNHQFTIRLLAELSYTTENDFRAVFLGNGPLLAATEEMASEMRLVDRISFLGSVSNPESWLHGADCVLMPSLYEGIPLSAVEAQCANCNLIASNKISPLIDLGLGNCYFLPLEVDAWVELIKRLMVERRPHFDCNTIEKAVTSKGFSPDEVAFRLRDYYESLNTIER